MIEVYAIDAMIGITLIFTGMIFWIIAARINQNKDRDAIYAILVILGLILHVMAFSNLIPYKNLNSLESAFMILVFMIYLILFLFGAYSFFIEREKSKLRVNERLEGIELSRLSQEKLLNKNKDNNHKHRNPSI